MTSNQKPPSEFSTAYPTTDIPRLPEYFRADTLDGIIPGEVVYPYGSIAIKADKSTGILFVSGKYDLDQGCLEPDASSIEGSRAGIVRIHEEIDGEMVEGFIADCRYLKPGSITPQTILPIEYDSDLDRKISEAVTTGEQFKPLLGAIFLDPDGKPHFSGKKNLQGHATSLMESVDARIAKKQTLASNPVTTPVLARTVIGPDYYHG